MTLNNNNGPSGWIRTAFHAEVVELVEWIWVPVAMLAGMIAAIMVIGLCTANDGKEREDE